MTRRTDDSAGWGTVLAIAGAAAGIFVLVKANREEEKLVRRVLPGLPKAPPWWATAALVPGFAPVAAPLWAATHLPPSVQRRAFAMWDSVKNAFWDFTAKLEGATPGHVGVPFMYQDVTRLITTGIGNLIDTASPSPTVTQAALSLPWKRADGSLASPSDIAQEWLRIRNAPFNPANGGFQYGKIATLHLDDADIQNLGYSKLADFEKTLIRRFPNYPTWPADAQLGLISMAWGLGAGFNYPKFVAAVSKNPPDFVTAANESGMHDASGRPNVPRNAANRQLFLNAAAVQANGSDPSVLHWPQGVS
jgi:hypothetical protein